VDSPAGGIAPLPPEFVETSSRAEQLVDRTVLDHSAVVQEKNPVALPTTPVGKIDKKAIARQLQA
jgi:non-ribosomal peptide synthetase component E (peptide arylation enzyme)